MSFEDRKFLLNKLGGIDERWQTSPSAARRIRDMVWDPKGGWRTSGGYELIYTGASSNPWTALGDIESIHWYSEHSGARQHLIIQANGRWYQTLEASKESVDVLVGKGAVSMGTHSTPTSPHARTQSLAWAGWLYLISGTDRPLVFNGRYLQQAGFDTQPPPPAPTFIVDAMYANTQGADVGIGDDSASFWARRYRVSYVNERGQEGPLSEPSAMVSGTNEEDAKTCVGLSVPRGGAHIVARRLYGTHNLLDSDGQLLLEGEAQNFYFMAEIQDNIQTSFEDVQADADLAAVVNPDNFGVWPTGAKYIQSFKNTIFLAGHQNNKVSFSAVGTSEVFPAGNSIRVGDDQSGEFTGMYPTKNALLVFKRNAIHMIKGDQVRGFEAFTLTKTSGCIGPDSIAEVPGMGVMFLGNKGPMLLEGALENTGTPTRVVPLWTPIPDLVERINKGAAIQAQGAVYLSDREYWLAVPMDGSSRNNVVLVYHYDIGAWSYRETMPVGCMVVTGDHREELLFGSNNSGTSAGVFVYSHGSSDKNGTAISPLYETTDIDFGDRYTAVVPETVTAWVIGYGNQDARIQYTVNRNYTQRYSLGSSEDSENQQDTTNDYDVLGTAEWGSSLWYNLRPVPVTFNVYTKDGAPVREFRFEISSDGHMLQLVGAEILASVTASDTKTEPLHIDLVVDRK
jgi:hypothetical protein|tara:strand:+ start:769 stop:2811 length:2043 start_codon:yes stop_codon:yes gene_type:complete